LLFVCYDEPSEYLFPLVPRYAVSDLPGGKTYTQEEAVVYWESLDQAADSTAQPPQKRERKRPNVASYITEVIRDTLQDMKPTVRQSVTPNMSSHSLRRGSAAYANASPKLAIQWISTRGAWLLESLTKAFAYIGTTTKEDQSVAKVLAGYESPDLPVVTPSIRDLRDRLSVLEYGQLITLRDELFRHVHGLPDARYNVRLEVVDTTFAALLIHVDDVLQATRAVTASQAHVARYRYELERGIAATNARLGSSLSVATCCEWGKHLKTRWATANHAHIGRSASENDTQLASVLEGILGQLTVISDRLARLEDVHAALQARAASANLPAATHAAPTTAHPGTAPLFAAAPAQATATTLAGCLLAWYADHIWETVKGKREQNKRAEAKAAVNILMILYQEPFEIPVEPSRADTTAYQAWKHLIWELALKMDQAANQRLHAFDQKKPTGKASSLRKRWRLLRASQPEACSSLCAQYLALKSIGALVDACTPASHLWTASDMA
jgi:hypothetical protein